MKDTATVLDLAKHMGVAKEGSLKMEGMKELQGQIQDMNIVQTAKISAEKIYSPETELSESLIDQILNDDDLLILTDDLQEGANLAATIGVLPAKFAVRENQSIQLEGDILAEEAAWATLADEEVAVGTQQEEAEEKDSTEGVIKFERLQQARHLKPLYIRAHIDGRPISRVLIDG